jgi:hypothetical protein
MPKNFVKIVSFGLIGELEDGSNYRHVIVEDLSNGRKTDYIVNQKQRPILWKDIVQLEKGKILPPYKGYITHINGLDIVVLGDESVEDAFAKQKLKLEMHKKISRVEVDRIRKETRGFCTDITHKGAMGYAWCKVEPQAKMIKFRYYAGKGSFTWSPWYEIEE